MKREHLDQFDQPENKQMCDIIQFPVDREVAFVRETARVLSIKHGKAADRFWQMTCRRLYARLQVQGITEDKIQAEVRHFSHAVFAQLKRYDVGSNESSNPKGAA